MIIAWFLDSLFAPVRIMLNPKENLEHAQDTETFTLVLQVIGIQVYTPVTSIQHIPDIHGKKFFQPFCKDSEKVT